MGFNNALWSIPPNDSSEKFQSTPDSSNEVFFNSFLASYLKIVLTTKYDKLRLVQ